MSAPLPNPPPPRSPLILIVDDLPEDRFTLRRYLTRTPGWSHRLVETQSVADAIAAAAVERPDCVILDYNLIDGDGLRLLRRLVESHGSHAFGIIMLTATADTSVAAEALKAGAHDYVEKDGLTATQLRRAVTNAIEKASIQRTLAAQSRELEHKNRVLASHVEILQREIDERARAQSALAQSEAFLQSIIGANTDCVAVIDLAGSVTWMNENGKELMEITDFDAVCARPWSTLWPEGEERKHAEHALAQARAGQVGRLSGLCPTLAGTLKWWDVIVTPIFGAGHTPERLLAVARDVTRARRIEQAIQETAVQLRTITDHLPVSVAQVDRQYRYRFANAFFTRRFGLTPEAIVGKHLVDVIGPAIFERYRPEMDRALAGEHVDLEIPANYGDEDRWFQASYVPERNSVGEVVGFVAVSLEITDRKRAETEVIRARDLALDAVRARESFLAALSHELRTPLNPVLLVASESAENPALAADVRETFRDIRDHVELEARLIDDLLDLSRISHGKLKLERHRISLHETLEDAISTVRGDIDAKHLVFETALAPGQPVVRADPVRLRQIIWNVLKNAVKFTPAEGHIRVSTSISSDGAAVELRVRDSGIGMTEKELARIFDAFAQGDHARESGSHRFGGLGLGLAITRMLVDAHGGTLHAESSGPGLGSTFTIRLPLVLPPAESGSAGTVAAPTASVAPWAAPAAGNARRILIVEDHAPTRQSLGVALRRRGFEVLHAGTSAEAEDLAKTHRLDVIISDIGLPDEDGYACLQRLRALQPTVPGIALSGYGMEEDLARSQEAGFDQHLTKPINIQALDRALTHVLNAAR